MTDGVGLRSRHCDKVVTTTRFDSNFMSVLEQVDPSRTHVTVDKDWRVLSNTDTHFTHRTSGDSASVDKREPGPPLDDIIVLDDD